MTPEFRFYHTNFGIFFPVIQCISPPELNSECVAEISRMRKDFSVFAISDTLKERPLLVEDQKVTLFTFAGSQVNRTIYFLLQLAGVKMIFDDQSSSFEINMSKDEFLQYWNKLRVPMEQIDEHVAKFVRENPAALEFSKWGVFAG